MSIKYNSLFLCLTIVSTIFAGFIFTLPVAYAHCEKFTSGGGVTVTTEDGKAFSFGQDFKIEFGDGVDISKNPDAKCAKNLRLERGETITVSVGTLEDAASGGLVDKDRSDNSIARGEGGDGIGLFRFECDRDRCSPGPLEVEIPEDIDRGKYKLVINRFTDDNEIQRIYINEVRVT